MAATACRAASAGRRCARATSASATASSVLFARRNGGRKESRPDAMRRQPPATSFPSPRSGERVGVWMRHLRSALGDPGVPGAQWRLVQRSWARHDLCLTDCGVSKATSNEHPDGRPSRGKTMLQSRDLAMRFEAYADWRRRLSAAISSLHEWLTQQDLADAQVDLKVQQLLERLPQDKLVVAFVAEFSRGKSE